eukprot:6187544-Pleurochrysis_carterae.AAC.1
MWQRQCGSTPWATACWSSSEKVKPYLDSIGCPFDVRAKGSRNLEQKWFSAASVDEFDMSNNASSNLNSPGLASSIWALVEAVFHRELPVRQLTAASRTSTAAAGSRPSAQQQQQQQQAAASAERPAARAAQVGVRGRGGEAGDGGKRRTRVAPRLGYARGMMEGAIGRGTI